MTEPRMALAHGHAMHPFETMLDEKLWNSLGIKEGWMHIHRSLNLDETGQQKMYLGLDSH
ncbi:hypothetical protein [Candidatus Entotheonella palauensis]|uniref:Uncharacterized protein n=1 Tax=Candidatus Entotheonella gemina TaxID=1429439 RepID=W4M7V5_9BACT|nr:hypothetical protein [Candidatus Entotheonella palauensis]ETX06006.1 MAG: hypothetical protein ETSY2_19625 [Candidatus Entotheonella gemina]